MQDKEDIIMELARLEKIKSENRDSNIRFWAIRWILKLETEQQYTEYMGR